jgi:hypothetical protein
MFAMFIFIFDNKTIDPIFILRAEVVSRAQRIRRMGAPPSPNSPGTYSGRLHRPETAFLLQIKPTCSIFVPYNFQKIFSSSFWLSAFFEDSKKVRATPLEVPP